MVRDRQAPRRSGQTACVRLSSPLRQGSARTREPAVQRPKKARLASTPGGSAALPAGTLFGARKIGVGGIERHQLARHAVGPAKAVLGRIFAASSWPDWLRSRRISRPACPSGDRRARRWPSIGTRSSLRAGSAQSWLALRPRSTAAAPTRSARPIAVRCRASLRQCRPASRVRPRRLSRPTAPAPRSRVG